MSVKSKNYTQQELEELNDKFVIAYIQETGWIQGFFTFDIQTENYKTKFDQIYSRRTNTFKIVHDLEPVFFDKVSYIIWVSQMPKGLNGLEPRFNADDEFIPASSPEYFIPSQKIKYIIEKESNDLFEYLKNNVDLRSSNVLVKQDFTDSINNLC